MMWVFPEEIPVESESGQAVLRLRRLTPGDARAVTTWCDEEALRYLSRRPTTWDEPGFAALIDGLAAMPATVFYAVEIDGEIGGFTAYLDISEANRRLEIGWTVYGAAFRGRGVNERVKHAMLDFAFSLGAVRVLMTTDERNTRSQRAIEKLGAQYEGTMRRYGRMPDGYQRDVKLYSILSEEWQGSRNRRAGAEAGTLRRVRAEFEQFDYGRTFNSRYRAAYALFETELRRTVREAADQGAPIRILDLGCGDGWTAGIVGEEASGRYAGIDTSENALRTLRSRFDARSRLQVAAFHAGAERLLDPAFDAEVRAFLGGHADVLVCNTALHQIRKSYRDVTGVCVAASGLVRKGGRVIVGDYWYPAEASSAEVEASREWIRAQSGQTPTAREGFLAPDEVAAALQRGGIHPASPATAVANEAIVLRYYVITGKKGE